MPATELESIISETENPGRYLQRLGFEPFPWQWVALEQEDPPQPKIMLTARQAGKSTVVGGKTLCRAKSGPGCLNLITCYSQKQSQELIQKIDYFILHDPHLPKLTHDGSYHKQFANRSRIIALPGSEESVRGYSAPRTIVVDEAARVPDETIFALRPMMTGAGTELFLLSTPAGKRGYFWRQWDAGKHWKKILVRIPYDLKDGQLVRAMPEAEYHQKMWEEQGILAYYSPRHDPLLPQNRGKGIMEHLEAELDNLGELWFRQEYLCEFVDVLTMIFPTELVDQAISDQVKPLEVDSVSDKVKPLEV